MRHAGHVAMLVVGVAGAYAVMLAWRPGVDKTIGTRNIRIGRIGFVLVHPRPTPAGCCMLHFLDIAHLIVCVRLGVIPHCLAIAGLRPARTELIVPVILVWRGKFATVWP